MKDNMRANQHKIIRFNHLLANMLIFHTVVYQTKAINKLKQEGIDVPSEVLAGISPYWTEHINRFGVFQLEMQKNIPEIEYDLL
ncbi:MAG: Tn3 family transposase [Rickettsiaceae bacterium]|nr:Tn3 family transposase [Rickettsiaceae bacterium]